MTIALHQLTDTWNSGATTFTAIEMDVTDTASAADSRLLALQVGGADKFDVDKNGYVTLPGGLRLLGYTSSALPPSTTELPNDKDASIHVDTNTTTVYLAYNYGGSTIVSVALS